MDRTPIRSKWADFFIRFHKGVFFRRQIIKELSKEKLEATVLKPMAKYYVACLLCPMGLWRIIRQERLAIKIAWCGALMSLSFLYIQIWFEEALFYFKGLENTRTGEIIRKKYMEEEPESWMVPGFRGKEKEYAEFYERFHKREREMEKFIEYANKRGVKIE
jgi:hypothetical protein